MSTYDQIIEEGIERGIERGQEKAFLPLLTVAHKQGIDIDKLAAQYNDLPRQRINELVAQVKQN